MGENSNGNRKVWRNSNPKKLKIKIGNFIVAENGKISENYDENKLKEYMQWDSIDVEINLKLVMMLLNVTLMFRMTISILIQILEINI